MFASFDRQAAQLTIILLVAVTALGLTAWATVTGHQTPEVVATLLGVTLGFLGQTVASKQGADQALAQPPMSSIAKIDEGKSEG